MKLAVVVGGWHFPAEFYEKMTEAAQKARMHGHVVDLFVVMHRNPESKVCRTEKLALIPQDKGAPPYTKYDQQLYSDYVTTKDLVKWDWDFSEHPNTIGDWGFFNQWLVYNNPDFYDVFLSTHDDCLVLDTNFLADVLNGTAEVWDVKQGVNPTGTVADHPDWLMINNARDKRTDPHVRSCTFFTREFLDLIGGSFDLGDRVTRIGQEDTPYGRMMRVLQDWNYTVKQTQAFINEKQLNDRCLYIGPYYRISKYLIECERGFVHWTNHGKRDFDKGMDWLGLKP